LFKDTFNMTLLTWPLLAVLLAGRMAQALYVDGSITAPCDSPIYCYGELLGSISLAQPFADSKTFADMPAKKPQQKVLDAFAEFKASQNGIITNNSALHVFLDDNFGQAGGELRPVDRDMLHTNATFLPRIVDADIREFTEKVIDIWPDLTRTYDPNAVACEQCPDSFLNMSTDPFVVAGGRFREPYYWDSYWTLLGLVRSSGNFTQIARNQIGHFLRFVDEHGFVPNGARVYYLNRSQPPMLSLMVKAYVDYTGDVSIIDEALPLLIKEHFWWTANRTVEIEVNGTKHTLNRYAVLNNQPRPESFREDWNMANNHTYWSAQGRQFREVRPLTDEQKADLYADLSTGAETGWDFTARWLRTPLDTAKDIYFPLRSLNTRELVPVELNSILYGNEVAIAELLRCNETMHYNETAADEWDAMAASRSESMSAVFWDKEHFRYFDYNLTAKAKAIMVVDDGAEDDEYMLFGRHSQQVLSRRGAAKQVFFHIGQFFPFWTGAAPSKLRSDPETVKRVFAPVRKYLDSAAGGIPATNFNSSEQWDEPNVWPPLMHALIDSLLSVAPPSDSDNDEAYAWTQQLALDLAQRWMDSVFCTWWESGGETSRRARLPGFGPDDPPGIMFEKYSSRSLIGAGGGGEYEVVEGFGWTNGVTIWAADVFAEKLKTPVCPEDEVSSVVERKRWLEERRSKVARNWAI
jgi:alpha,alpha-trehalase